MELLFLIIRDITQAEEFKKRKNSKGLLFSQGLKPMLDRTLGVTVNQQDFFTLLGAITVAKLIATVVLSIPPFG